MIRVFLLTVTIFVATLPNFSFAEHPNVLPLIDGTRVSASLHPTVAKLSMNGQALCTGTLVAPDALITAAHCFFDDRNIRVVGDADVTATFPAGTFHSKKVIINNAYMPRAEACIENETDIAVVFFTTTVPGVVPSKVSSSAPYIGSSIQLVGYGSEGDAEFGMNGVLPPAGMVNEGNTPVESISGSYLEWIFDKHETNTAGGDSGGPAFSTFNDHAITSITCGGGGSAQVGTDSLNTRIDTAVPWLLGVIPGLQVAPPEPLIRAGKSFFIDSEVVIPVTTSLYQNAELTLGQLPDGLTFDGRAIRGHVQRPGFYQITTHTQNSFGGTDGVIEFESFDAFPFSGQAKGKVTLNVSKKRAEKVILDIPVKLQRGLKLKGSKITIALFGSQKKFILSASGVSKLTDGSSLAIRGRIVNGALSRSSAVIHVELHRVSINSDFSIANALANQSSAEIPLKLSVGNNPFKGVITPRFSKTR